MLAKALHLPPVDGLEAPEDRGEAAARELAFDLLDQPIDGVLPVVVESMGRDRLPGEAPAEVAAEPLLGRRGDPGVVEVVVGVGIEHAVGERGGRERHREPEEHLNAVDDPGVAQRLADLLQLHVGIEGAGLAHEFLAGGEEVVGEEEVPVAAGPAEAFLSEVADRLPRRLPPGEALRLRLRIGLDLRRQVIDQTLRLAGVVALAPAADGLAEDRVFGSGLPPEGGVAGLEVFAVLPEPRLECGGRREMRPGECCDRHG